MQEHFDELVGALPPRHAARIPEFVEQFCDRDTAAGIRAFLEPRMQGIAGGPRNLARSLERIELCAASLARHRDDALVFFNARWSPRAVYEVSP